MSIYVTASLDFGRVVRSRPCDGTHPHNHSRFIFVSPTGINTGHHESLWISRPNSLAWTAAQCELSRGGAIVTIEICFLPTHLYYEILPNIFKETSYMSWSTCHFTLVVRKDMNCVSKGWFFYCLCSCSIASIYGPFLQKLLVHEACNISHKSACIAQKVTSTITTCFSHEKLCCIDCLLTTVGVSYDRRLLKGVDRRSSRTSCRLGWSPFTSGPHSKD